MACLVKGYYPPFILTNYPALFGGAGPLGKTRSPNNEVHRDGPQRFYYHQPRDRFVPVLPGFTGFYRPGSAPEGTLVLVATRGMRPSAETNFCLLLSLT